MVSMCLDGALADGWKACWDGLPSASSLCLKPGAWVGVSGSVETRQEGSPCKPVRFAHSFSASLTGPGFPDAASSVASSG